MFSSAGGTRTDNTSVRSLTNYQLRHEREREGGERGRKRGRKRRGGNTIQDSNMGQRRGKVEDREGERGERREERKWRGGAK